MKKEIKFVLRIIGNVIGIMFCVIVITGIFALINRLFGQEVENIVLLTCFGVLVLILALSMTKKKRERIDFSLTREMYSKMEEAAKEDNIGIPLLLKRILALYLHIQRERRDGRRLCFVNEYDEIVKEVDFS